jgi:hypothetical protein
MTELQEHIDKCNSLLETTRSSLDEKENIIAGENQRIAEFERMQKDFGKRISARKYLIGEKHHKWD